MGLFSWLTGAANRSAKNNNRSAKQQQKKKKKRQQQRQEHHTNPRPAQRSGHSSSNRSGGGSGNKSGYRPKAYKASEPKQKPRQQTVQKPQTKGYTPQVFRASQVSKPSVPSTNASKRYESYKASSYSKPTRTKTYDAVAASKKAYEASKKARAEQAKKGVVTSQAKKPKSNVISDLSKPKGYNYKKDLQKAYKTGSKTTALGTKVKTHKTKIDKNTTLKSEDLSRSDFARMMDASKYGKKMGNNLLKGGARTGQKDIREKVGSKTAESAYKSKLATGIIQGMSKADVFSASVGTYNKAAKKAIEKTKKSAAYNVGYGIGMAADMSMGGVATRGASIAKGSGKLAAKVVGKSASKGVPKKVAKEAAEEYAKVSKKQAMKRLAKNRAGEIAAETPANILDAAKMSMDTDGKLNKKEFRKWVGINTALTGGVGGAIEGIGAGATKKLASNTADLLAKREAGTITQKELVKLQKNIKRLSGKAKGEVNTLSKDIADARMQTINARDSIKKAEKYGELAKDSAAPGRKQATKKGRFTYESSQSRYRYAQKLKENEKRVAERARKNANEFATNPERAATVAERKARKQTANAHIKGAAGVTENARINEVHRLSNDLGKLRKKLKGAEKRAKTSGTMEGHARAVAEVEETRKAISIKEKQLKNAQRNTLSGRLGKAQADAKNAGTLAGHERAARRLEKVEAEVKADSERKLKLQQRQKKLEDAANAAEAKAEANPTPANTARAKVLREGAEKLKAQVKEAEKAAAKSAETAEANKPLGDRFKDAGLPEYTHEWKPKDIKDGIKRFENDEIPRLKKELEEAKNSQRGAFARGDNSAGRHHAKRYNDLKAALESAEEQLGVMKQADEIASKYAKETEAPKEKPSYKERQQAKVDNYEENIRDLDTREAEIQAEIDKLDAEGKKYGGQKKNATDPDRIAELDKELERIDLERESLYSEMYQVRRERTEIHNKSVEAQEKVRKIEEAKRPEGGYKSLPGEEADRVGIKETPAVEKTAKETAEDLDNAPVKPKTASVSRISESGTVDATTKAKKGLNQFYHNVVRTALVDSLDPLEHIANHLPNEQRKAMLAQINELRRAVKTGRAIVATKGRDIYAKYDLTKRANKAKLADFERYAFLKHDLARVKEGTGFTGLSENQILKEMDDLESKYSEELFPVIDKKTGEVLGSELQFFQQDMVKYFRDLLQDEVDSGITSQKVADDFIKRFPDYVPSYRQKEFDGILKNRTFEEIDVGRGMKAAKGGGDGLVSLYNQMQVKTNTVIKRTELNKTLNMLCTASGTSEKELDKLVPFFKDMRPEEKAEALMDAQIFPHATKNGKYTAFMYREGSKIEMNIDKDVYDAIRRWSGEDRKVHVLTSLLNNRVLGSANSAFKKWITDYNLIFGVKNFCRDQATALFYTTDKVGYVKNMMKGIGVSMLPKEMLPKSWHIYKDAFDVYKQNGGVISQFIARDSASDRLFDTAFKANPLRLVENFNSSLETIPRMTEFISALDAKALKNAGKDGDYAAEFTKLLGDKNAVTDAMYRAKDVTLNFDRSGWLGAVLNRGPVPFFNPAAQGFDKLGRTLIRDNIKYGENGAVLWAKTDGQGLRSFFDDTTMGSFLKLGAYLTGMVVVPEVAWNGMFGDKINGEAKGWEKQSDYNRDTHYLLPFGDGKFLKIPKARELASLQMVLDYVYDNMEYGSGSTWDKLFGDNRVRDLKSMAKLSFEQSGPINPLTDSIFAPVWRVKNNKTWYGGQIESGADDLRHREDGELYKIWDENTSALAKAIGKQWNMSPKKVDNVLDSYLGLIYDMGIAQTSAKNDVTVTKEKEGIVPAVFQLTRTPWGNAFIIDSVFQNANKSDYYSYNDRLQKKLDGLKEGTDEYNKVKAEMSRDKNAFSYTSSQYDELQAQIWLSDKMTVAEKRKYCRLLKKNDNLLWNERKDGSKVPSRDPMAVAWNMKDKNGKRIMSTDKIIESCSFTSKKGTNVIGDAWELYKKNGGKSASKFVEATLAARDVKRAAGDSLSTPRWEEVAYTNQLRHIKGSDKVLESYIEDETKRNNLKANAKIWEEHGGDKKSYYGMKRTVTQEAYKLGYDYASEMRDGELTMVLATHRTKAGKQYRDLEYQPNGTYILDNRMNAGRCLDVHFNSKYNQKELKAFCDKYDLNPSEGHKWTDEDCEKVAKAIKKEHKDYTAEEMAAEYVVITGRTYKNPFGSIGDYSIDSDTGVYCVDAWGNGRGRRRRRHRRRWHGWGHGGGGGGGFSPQEAKMSSASDAPKAKEPAAVKTSAPVKAATPKTSAPVKVSMPKASAPVRSSAPTRGRSTSSGGSRSGSTSGYARRAARSIAKAKVTDVTFKSNLDDAYRRDLKKLREKTRHNK